MDKFQGQPYTRDVAQVFVRVGGPGGQMFQGWTQSEVERSLETIAGTFSVPITLVPGHPPAIKRQDQVEVLINKTVVISGFVLSAEPFYRRDDCGMRIIGRDRTGDLVRCTAIHKGGQWRKVKIDRIVRDLVAPFGIDVVVQADIGGPITEFKLSHGEPVLDALSRVARLRGVLVTRDDQGRLLLTRAGQQRFEGVIARGMNVISMDGIGTDEQRHSEYVAYGQHSAEGMDFESSRSQTAKAFDAEIKRYLPLVVNADGSHLAGDLKALVEHTARVRRGHAYGFKYVVEGWTFNGKPWPLNARVLVYDDIAGLHGDEWLICSVRQTCDLREGDVTELVVRPIEAYDTIALKSKVRRDDRGNRNARDKAKLEKVVR
jgi:prophage tail gpP-like protein